MRFVKLEGTHLIVMLNCLIEVDYRGLGAVVIPLRSWHLFKVKLQRPCREVLSAVTFSLELQLFKAIWLDAGTAID